MDKRPMKTVGESRTEQVQIVLPGHSNGRRGRLFGGRLMEWIDVVAAVVARRHSGVNVTTAAVDNLQFKAAAHIGDTVLLVGQMTWTGNTSMEVRVDVYVENLGGDKALINQAYLVLVAIDQEETRFPSPACLPLYLRKRRNGRAASAAAPCAASAGMSNTEHRKFSVPIRKKTAISSQLPAL